MGDDKHEQPSASPGAAVAAVLPPPSKKRKQKRTIFRAVPRKIMHWLDERIR